MKTKTLGALLTIFAFIIVALACNKNKNARLSVYLTDDPAAYDAVNIDVQQIFVHVDGGGWTEIPLQNPGVYNLLDFTNGMDVLLSSSEIPPGKLSQMRLVLGDNNTVIIDGKSYDLITPSSEDPASGLKFNIHAELVEGIEYKIWIDFEAGRSIFETVNNTYLLKPLIRTYTKATTGAIKGIAMPLEANPWVYAITAGNDTAASAKADDITGEFLLGGLDAGTYNVSIDGTDNMYQDSVVNGVSVTIGEVNNIGTITLNHQ